jgi:hypothetical protein
MEFMMQEHQFTIFLAAPEQSEDDAAALYEAGCSDGSISTSAGVTRIDFHRESTSLVDAIRSAIADIESAGFDVDRVEFQRDALVEA